MPAGDQNFVWACREIKRPFPLLIDGYMGVGGVGVYPIKVRAEEFMDQIVAEIPRQMGRGDASPNEAKRRGTHQGQSHRSGAGVRAQTITVGTTTP